MAVVQTASIEREQVAALAPLDVDDLDPLPLRHLIGTGRRTVDAQIGEHRQREWLREQRLGIGGHVGPLQLDRQHPARIVFVRLHQPIR